MMNYIESRDNKILKTARSLKNRKGRQKSGLYFAEGVRLVNDALAYAPNSVSCLIASETFSKQNSEFIKGADEKNFSIYITNDKLFDDICNTETPQGIAALMKIPNESEIDFANYGYVLVLDGVSEPGNMGAVIRTAEAAGVDFICLINNCVDIYNPKTVRSAMGSVFRMSFKEGEAELLDELKSTGFTVAATALKNSQPIEDTKICGKRAIIIGNEAHGVSDEALKFSDMAVRISMGGRVESLNAAVAAGIAMYLLKP